MVLIIFLISDQRHFFYLGCFFLKMFLGSLETARFTGVLWGGSYRPGNRALVFHKVEFSFSSYSEHRLLPRSSHQSSDHRFILHWEYFRILYNIEQERQMLHLNLYFDACYNASDEPGYSWFAGGAPCFILPKGFSSFSLLPCFSTTLHSPSLPSQTFSHPLSATRSHSPQPLLQENHMPGVCFGESLQICIETKESVFRGGGDVEALKVLRYSLVQRCDRDSHLSVKSRNFAWLW